MISDLSAAVEPDSAALKVLFFLGFHLQDVVVKLLLRRGAGEESCGGHGEDCCACIGGIWRGR